LWATAVGTATGLAVTLAGVDAYAFLASTNVRSTPDIPWAPAVAILLLWLYWRWLGGWGRPRARFAERPPGRRGAPPPPRGGGRWRVRAAGLAGFVFAGSAMTFGFRLSDLPPDAFRAPPAPLWTLLPAIVVLSVVAGVCEEVGVRGYLQKAVEEAGTPAAAIL